MQTAHPTSVDISPETKQLAVDETVTVVSLFVALAGVGAAVARLSLNLVGDSVHVDGDDVFDEASTTSTSIPKLSNQKFSST